MRDSDLPTTENAEPSSSQTLEEKRVSELTERVQDFLCEGEEFLIRCQDEEIEVIPGPRASLVRRNHEELYGLLLSLNQQLAEAAAIPRWLVRFVILTMILAVHLEWLSALPLPVQLEKLQSVWVYGLILLLGYAVNTMLKEWRQHQIYSSRRPEFLRLLQESGLPKYRLLTQINEDPAVSDFAHMLKRDHAQEVRY